MSARSAVRGNDPACPLEAEAFARLMAPLGPFEPAPRIAAAVSGGADSLALAILLRDWAASRAGTAAGTAAGTVVALIVDHGLRPESAAEARRVRAQLLSEGLEAQVLRWRGPKPGANLQAAARAARYRLLEDWCARRTILHLALAHHLDDQSETLLLRLGRGSGLDGLAAMAPLVERPRVRRLRPLLSVPRARLKAFLEARGLDWVEDPANRDPAHARVRLRQLAPSLAREGLTAERLAGASRHLARARAALEAATAELLARAVAPDPAGFAWLDPGPWSQAPCEVRLRALARILMMAGGADYTPRLDSLERLAARLVAGLERGATLAGCRVLPRRGRLLVAREAKAAAARAVRPGESLLWDRRFEVRLDRRTPTPAGGLVLGPLGEAGWAEAAAARPALRDLPLPAPARLALPALFDGRGLLEVPLLSYLREPESRPWLRLCRFAPPNTLAPARFTVA